jgi:hypothetical protein
MISAGWFCEDPEDQCLLQAFPSEVQEKARYVWAAQLMACFCNLLGFFDSVFLLVCSW